MELCKVTLPGIRDCSFPEPLSKAGLYLSGVRMARRMHKPIQSGKKS